MKACMFHPGGEALTLEAARACGWKEGDRILDVGCGGGASMALLKEQLGVKPVGCDTDPGMLQAAKALDSSFVLRETDGMSLDFPSRYFDGALLECSFSLMDRHDELLHELFCVLKPGARLAISDLYFINPDAERANETYYEARRILNTPRQEGDCEKADTFPSPYLLDGMFVIDHLITAIRDAGFELTLFRDRTRQLQDWYAQLLMDHGSLEGFWADNLPAGTRPCCRARLGRQTGYFLLCAEKQAE